MAAKKINNEDGTYTESLHSIKLALHNWSYRDFLKFQEYSSTDPRRAYALVQKIISSWSYAIGIEERDALSRLDIEDAGEVLQTIKAQLEVYFDEMDVAEVQVDFRKAGWNSLNIFAFQKALNTFDYNAIVNAISEAATLEGVTPKNSLSMIDGSMMVKAITARYSKAISGNS